MTSMLRLSFACCSRIRRRVSRRLPRSLISPTSRSLASISRSMWVSRLRDTGRIEGSQAGRLVDGETCLPEKNPWQNDCETVCFSHSVTDCFFVWFFSYISCFRNSSATASSSLYHSSPKRLVSGPFRNLYMGRSSSRPFFTASRHTSQRW